MVIDKPGGITSHDVVSRLRRITGERSIGHLGTLDPMATGVLPLLLGRFTRLAQYFSTAEKTYTGSIRFGFATDTCDADGVPTGPPVPFPFTLDQVRAAASPFHGEIQQTPPVFSAKKIAGKPAYKLAREGKPVVMKPVAIRILDFRIATLEADAATFEISVSAGGYVRSVAHDLGQALGTGAHLSSLRRTRAGCFTLHQAHSLESLESLALLPTAASGGLTTAMIHPRTLLPEMPSVAADSMALGRMRNGGQANLAEFSHAELVKVFSGQDELVAIARRIAGTLFQPVAVLG